MITWNTIGDPIPALDGFEANDQGESENTAVMIVETTDAHNLIKLAAWDDGLGLDVDLLITLPNAKTLRDRLAQAIETIQAREQQSVSRGIHPPSN
ncbi:hypothetical protein Psi02_43430 [Planotetraspora silvatica]|uniref:Uncharacterized protein n=1 Tax=Planotetraspora silvatica TaxID=234614 RepID=A0A8J3UL97_9ACTN|nr:hypothetical protein [Planotetraspora silvatica]GII47919.1 hypothetical protein Psi02_43430 [Planotetraspora silvatica]